MFSGAADAEPSSGRCWRSGFDFWQLAPRGDLLVPIGILLALPWLTRLAVARGKLAQRRRARARRCAGLLGRRWRSARCSKTRTTRPGELRTAAELAWRRIMLASRPATGVPIGHSWYGDKYTPLAQITPANAKDLKVAWHIHTGDLKRSERPGGVHL